MTDELTRIVRFWKTNLDHTLTITRDIREYFFPVNTVHINRHTYDIRNLRRQLSELITRVRCDKRIKVYTHKVLHLCRNNALIGDTFKNYLFILKCLKIFQIKSVSIYWKFHKTYSSAVNFSIFKITHETFISIKIHSPIITNISYIAFSLQRRG